MSDSKYQEKMVRNALARALWRVDNKGHLPDDTEATKQAYLSRREHYVAKANQVINQVKRQGVALVQSDMVS